MRTSQEAPNRNGDSVADGAFKDGYDKGPPTIEHKLFYSVACDDHRRDSPGAPPVYGGDTRQCDGLPPIEIDRRNILLASGWVLRTPFKPCEKYE